ncbi:MAG TPA: hypothetical protein VJP77_04845, partial [Planctomycetota bacterium]|nr:hypothetical protein [Planctomycetota bacterium]
YEPAGALVFSGGLTSARAHEGDNRGRDAVRHFVLQGAVVERGTPVYGCALFDDALAPPPPTVPPTSPPAAPSALES